MGADRKVRAAAVTTWVYAAGFGVPTVPVAVYLMTQGRLPTFAAPRHQEQVPVHRLHAEDLDMGIDAHLDVKELPAAVVTNVDHNRSGHRSAQP